MMHYYKMAAWSTAQANLWLIVTGPVHQGGLAKNYQPMCTSVLALGWYVSPLDNCLWKTVAMFHLFTRRSTDLGS